MKTGFVFLCAALVLASCSAGAAPVAETATRVSTGAVTAESLPAVTDQEIDALIDVVMQGVDVPRP